MFYKFFSKKHLRCIIVLSSPLIIFIIFVTFQNIIRKHKEQRLFKELEVKYNLVQEKCRMPKLQLWPEGYQHLYSAPKPLNCKEKNGENWIQVKNGLVYLNKIAQTEFNSAKCTITPIYRLDEFEIKRKNSYPLVEGDPIPSDVFQVNCIGKNNRKHSLVYHSIKPIKKAFNQKLMKVRETSDQSVNGIGLDLDIILFGFDSVSHLTWLRNLPKSHEYFTKNLNAIVMEGYNILGDGTPQALFPILTGKTEIELPEARRGFTNAKNVDSFPWIWNELRDKAGYVTQWGEDSPGMGTFTYRMLGFQNQPVDHYLRTFMVANNKLNPDDICYGSEPMHRVMMNATRDMLNLYPSNQRKFTLNFHAVYSHGSTNLLQLADQDLKDLLEDLQETGKLDKALLIVFSDHGGRFQALRNSAQGKFEERMPYMGIRLPPKIIEKFPEIEKSLKLNSKRLTTPFDIHETLMEVLNFNATESSLSYNSKKDAETMKLPRGLSLFRPIPEKRTCQEAEIEPHWCTCLSWVAVDTKNKIVRNAARELVKKIESQTKNERNICSLLSLRNITHASMFIPRPELLMFKGSSDAHGRIPDFSDDMSMNEVYYQITVQMKPGDAIFEATLVYTMNINTFSVSTRDISRTNEYGDQPRCIRDRLPNLRPYCLCKDYLNGFLR